MRDFDDLVKRVENIEHIVFQMMLDNDPATVQAAMNGTLAPVTPIRDDDKDELPPEPTADPKVCPHQHQVLVQGVIKCAKCGEPLFQSGVIGDPARHSAEASRTEWAQRARDSGPDGPSR